MLEPLPLSLRCNASPVGSPWRSCDLPKGHDGRHEAVSTFTWPNVSEWCYPCQRSHSEGTPCAIEVPENGKVSHE